MNVTFLKYFTKNTDIPAIKYFFKNRTKKSKILSNKNVRHTFVPPMYIICTYVSMCQRCLQKQHLLL